jgi:transcriptional regulator with XRE-family HTH domain
MAVNSRKLIVLGNNVRKFRRKAELTQEQLAYKVRVSPTYIGFIEQAQRNPSLKTLDKIARALKVSSKDLL